MPGYAHFCLVVISILITLWHLFQILKEHCLFWASGNLSAKRRRCCSSHGSGRRSWQSSGTNCQDQRYIKSKCMLIFTIHSFFLNLIGCYVIGFAGSDDKVKWLVDELGFDKAYNYKTADWDKSLKEAAPKGVDCYFDNVKQSTLVICRFYRFNFFELNFSGWRFVVNNDS